MKKATLEYWVAPHDSLGGPHADGAPERERNPAAKWDKGGMNDEGMIGRQLKRWRIMTYTRHQAHEVGSFNSKAACRTGTQTCTLISMCTLMGREGPYSFKSIKSRLSLKLQNNWATSTTSNRHIPIFLNCNTVNLLSIHSSVNPSFLPSLSMNTAQWVRDAHARSVTLCQRINLLNLLWSRQVWPPNKEALETALGQH